MEPENNNDLRSTQNTPPIQPQPPSVPLPTSEVHDYLHPIVDQPTRVSHPKAVRTVLIVVVGLSLLGVGLALLAAYLPQTDHNVDQSTANTISTTTKTKLSSAEALVRIKAVFADAQPSTTSITTPVRVPGNNFYTIVPDATHVVGASDTIAQAKVPLVLDKLHTALAEYGLERNVINDTTGNTAYRADYVHADITCQITATNPAGTDSSQVVEAKCLDMSVYAKYATAQTPFYNVYSPAQTTSSEISFTGMPAETPSVTAGYQLVELPVSSIANGQVVSASVRAMFYQTPNGIWYYFKDRTQTLIACEQYNTDVLKYAYVDQPCHSLAKDIDTTVPAVKKKS